MIPILFTHLLKPMHSQIITLEKCLTPGVEMGSVNSAEKDIHGNVCQTKHLVHIPHCK